MGRDEGPHFGRLAAASGDARPFRSEAAERLDRVLADAIAEGKRSRPMSKLAAVAERMAKKRAEHDAHADRFMAKLDAIDKAEPAAIARGEAFLAEREADMREFEDTLRQLSNLPLGGGEKSGPG